MNQLSVFVFSYKTTNHRPIFNKHSKIGTNFKWAEWVGNAIVRKLKVIKKVHGRVVLYTANDELFKAEQ